MMDKLNGSIFWLEMMACKKKNNMTWNKVSPDIEKEFNSEQLLTWILHLKKDGNYCLPKFNEK